MSLLQLLIAPGLNGLSPARLFKSRNTVMKLWEPVVKMSKDPKSLSDARYGMGWAVLPRSHEHAFGRNQGKHI